uniref:Retrovirus-related Pol polyprotein from transposon TNT 1-94 n=1 Tax=Strongyloides venezuelensis TaxID=75913 RepID=A0A0K0FQC7_STRVS
MKSKPSSDLITKIKRIVMELRSKGINVDEEEQVLILLGALPSSYEAMISTLSSNVKLNEVIERLRYQDELKTPEITENASFYAKRYSKSNNQNFLQIIGFKENAIIVLVMDNLQMYARASRKKKLII